MARWGRRRGPACGCATCSRARVCSRGRRTCVTSARVQENEAEGFYYQTAYRLPKQPVAPGTAVKPADTAPLETFPVKSIIARPGDGARAKVGSQEVVGVAFSGVAAIARVEVST